jgi:quinol monooxygenase YgiN
MAGVANIPWYATVFRGDQFEAALREIAPIALRYGATDYEVLRSNDDRYRFMQLGYFEDKDDFERYWYGPEFNEWRADYTSWYQVPVVYGFFDRVARGALNGNANGVGATGRASAQTEDY